MARRYWSAEAITNSRKTRCRESLSVRCFSFVSYHSLVWLDARFCKTKPTFPGCLLGAIDDDTCVRKASWHRPNPPRTITSRTLNFRSFYSLVPFLILWLFFKYLLAASPLFNTHFILLYSWCSCWLFTAQGKMKWRRKPIPSGLFFCHSKLTNVIFMYP